MVTLIISAAGSSLIAASAISDFADEMPEPRREIADQSVDWWRRIAHQFSRLIYPSIWIVMRNIVHGA